MKPPFMESHIHIAEKLGLIGKVLLYAIPNTYYPDSISQFIDERQEIRYSQHSLPPFSWLFNGKTLVVINSCFYTPQREGYCLLSDLCSDLEVDIVNFNGVLPIGRTHITNVLLELKELKEFPRLVKYGAR